MMLGWETQIQVIRLHRGTQMMTVSQETPLAGSQTASFNWFKSCHSRNASSSVVLYKKMP